MIIASLNKNFARRFLFIVFSWCDSTPFDVLFSRFSVAVMFLFAYLILVLGKGQIDPCGPIASRNVPVASKPNWSRYRATVTYASDIELFLEFLPRASFVAVSVECRYPSSWVMLNFLLCHFKHHRLCQVVISRHDLIHVHKKWKDIVRPFIFLIIAFNLLLLDSYMRSESR